MSPFVVLGRGKPIAMSYRRVPEWLLDDPGRSPIGAQRLGRSEPAALIGALRGPNQSSSMISDDARSKAWSLAIKMTLTQSHAAPFC